MLYGAYKIQYDFLELKIQFAVYLVQLCAHQNIKLFSVLQFYFLVKLWHHLPHNNAVLYCIFSSHECKKFYQLIV